MFTHHVQMRFTDIDLLGHVNHARYIGFLEEAHLAFLTAPDGPAFTLTSVIIAHWEIDYVRPATLSRDPISVSLWVTHVGRASFGLGYVIEQAGSVVARANSVIVSYDYRQARSRALSGTHRAGLERWRKS